MAICIDIVYLHSDIVKCIILIILIIELLIGPCINLFFDESFLDGRYLVDNVCPPHLPAQVAGLGSKAHARVLELSLLLIVQNLVLDFLGHFHLIHVLD